MTLPRDGFKREHKLGVPVNHDIRIVGDDDHLATEFRFPQALDEQLVYQRVVQVVFGLVKNYWLRTVTEYECQQRRRLLPRRSLRKRSPILLLMVAKAHGYGVFRNVKR